MKIYLDINGTIIHGRRPAPDLKKFLQYVLENHDVYWLSTMCQGKKEEVIWYLSQFLSDELLELTSKIKPTSWNDSKIEAIDLDGEFLWFDDMLMPEERELLEEKGKIDSFVRVSHHKNDNFFADWLKNR